MNFRENYQREMSKIEKPADITEKVLIAADMEQETYAAGKNRNIPKNGAIWKTAVATIAIVCVLGLCLQHEKVTGFAQSALNHLRLLSVNNEEIEFDEIEPIKIYIEGYSENEQPYQEGGRGYFRAFNSYQEMNQHTQLELPYTDKVEYKNLAVDIISNHKTGRVTGDIIYKGESFAICGMFKLDGFDEKNWGYGDFGTKEVYQYGDGKSACFVEDRDGVDTVYFVEGNILFQMAFNVSGDMEMGATANKKQVKDLLKLFGREN